MKKTSLLSRLPSDLLGGFVLGLYIVISSISYAALIYSGSLSSYFPIGFKFILIGSVLITLISALYSSLSINIAAVQSDALPVYAAMAAAIASMLSAQHVPSTSIFLTVLTTIAIATFTTGIIFYLMGVFKLGKFISFVPYPVIGGFLAGIGWLLFAGAFYVVLPSQNVTLLSIFQPISLAHWVPSILFALVVLFVTQRSNHPLVWPTIIILALLVFYVVAFISHLSISNLREMGYLLKISTTGTNTFSWHDFSLRNISFTAIESQITSILAIGFFGTIAMLFNATGLEVLLKNEIDFNRELRVASYGNFFSAAAGSLSGYVTLSCTSLNQEFQQAAPKKTRLIGIVTACVCFLSLFLGNILEFFPYYISGGLLMYSGFSFIKQWIYDVRKTLPAADYFIILIIVFTIGFIGLLEGLLMGVIFSICFFIVKYSYINTIQFEFSGTNFHSKKQYDPATQQLLSQQGDSILYLQLQNYLFFGNANALLQKLRQKVSSSPSIRYVIYSFEHILGMDSSAMISFEKIKQFAEKETIQLILTNMEGAIYTLFEKSNIIMKDNPNLTTFKHYNDALEWCEQDIIFKNQHELATTVTLESRLLALTDNMRAIKNLKDYFEQVNLAKDQYLFHQNDNSNDLYYIESGHVAVFLELKNNEIHHLRTLGPGNTIGEIALYTKKGRTASVVAEEDCVLQKLSLDDIETIEIQHPMSSGLLLKFIVKILAERLIYTNKQIEIFRESPVTRATEPDS